MEPLEGTASQEEGCHNEWAVRVCSLILLHILSLPPSFLSAFSTGMKMCSDSFLHLLPYLAHGYGHSYFSAVS